ncbi:MAG: tRNA 2-thiouridine(34) synthase MnmA [Nitrospirae bacterium]|nr:MAG: tRNA 2-thiouridine(34) synthase MnmA [Nitrospirota bacterium]
MIGPTVLLGMSGGVDSSVAAALLVEQGYRVQGVTLQVWEHEDESVAASKRWEERGCCKVGLARFVAQRLGIPHEVVDTRNVFRAGVIDDFLSGYLAGTTPNPCVRCNERVKLRSLLRLAQERRVDFVATGHYARVVERQGRLGLHRACDVRKDQSYFLYRLDPAWLAKLLFPVGSMQKAEVWARAESLGLPADELKESQEICFISHGDYRTFIKSEAPESKRRGNFVDPAGHVLGQHDGVAYYTPGQRRGLGIATGQRLYVQRVEAATQTVVLGPEEELFRSDCLIGEVNLFDDALRTCSTEAQVKIRYATPAAPATVSPDQNDMMTIRFAAPQRALSPGQSAVFYDGDRVLGGGIIQ